MTEYDTPQRATLVLEHLTSDDDWHLVAYLVRDNGKRERVTIRRCNTRTEAAEALKEYWGRLIQR